MADSYTNAAQGRRWTCCLLLTVIVLWPAQASRLTHPSGPIIKLGSSPDTEGICTSPGFRRNATDCARFYRCVDFNMLDDKPKYTIFRFMCGPNTFFDEVLSVCVWPSRAKPPCTITVQPSQPIVTSTTICAKPVNVTRACLQREQPVYLTFDEDTERMMDEILRSTPPLLIEETKAPGNKLFQATHSPVLIKNSDRITSSRSIPEEERQSPLSSIIASSLTAVRTVTTTNTFFVQHCTLSPFPFSICSKRQ